MSAVKRRAAWRAAAVAMLGLSACAESPMDLRPTDTPPPITAVAVACRVDVTREVASCASGVPGSGASVAMATAAAMEGAPRIPAVEAHVLDVVDLGGQGNTVGIDLLDLGRSGDTLLVATVRLTNRLDQPLGMITPVALDVDAVRFGIVDGPTALPSGTVTVDAPDGRAFFTAADQPFARFEAPIQPNERQWRDVRFRLSPGVTGFTFRAIVRAALPDETPARVGGQPVRFSAVRLARSASVTSGGCVIAADTRMPYCFGSNESGQVGSGAGQIVVPGPAGHGRFSRLIGTVIGNVCGLRADERWFCWGFLPPFIAGEDVNATEVRRVFPGIAAREIAIGQSFGCALDADGRAWCGGDNEDGQLGSGALGGFGTVARVAGGLTFRSLTAGTAFACGITQARAVFCWGRNANGQLGQGTTSSRGMPMRIAAVTDSVVQVAAYTDGACALTQGGAVWCWGNNDFGAVGTGQSGGNVLVPVQVIGSGVVQLAAGQIHVCARRTDGTVECWGSNGSRQTGTPGLGDVASPTPIDATGYAADSLAVGGDNSCYRQGGNWTCFGANFEGEAGVTPAGNTLAPTPVPGLNGLRQVVLGLSGGCALTATDDLWCWGRGIESQFPAGPRRFASTAMVGVFGGRPFTHVERGELWTCGLRPAGGVYCWGRNPVNSSVSAIPDTVLTGVSFRQLSVGARHACGLSVADSTAWCWGDNTSGQLGVSGPATSIPIQVTNSPRFASIAAGSDFTCAIDRDGAPWCWGDNTVGQLGRGTSGPGANALAQRVTGSLRFTSLEAGVSTACGITAAREAICWGRNGGNLLGIGSEVPFTPFPVATILILQVKQLAIGTTVGCGVSISGEVYCGGQGALGTGFGESGTLRRVPIPVPVTSVSVGPAGSCAVDFNGRLWCWGSVGFTTATAAPTLVTLR